MALSTSGCAPFSVDWQGLKNDPMFEGQYKDLLGQLDDMREERMSDAEWKASHLNIWNAMFIHVCAEHGTSLEGMNSDQRMKHFAEDAYRVGGETLSLLDIEEKLVQTTQDPRVLFGLSKQTMASPPLAVYTENVDRQIIDVIRYHCKHEVNVDLEHSEIELPRLFMESETGRAALDDFVKHGNITPANRNGLIMWVNDYLPQNKKVRDTWTTFQQDGPYHLGLW